MLRQSTPLNEFDMRSSSDVFHHTTTLEKCVWHIKQRPVVSLLVFIVVTLLFGALFYYTTDVFRKPLIIKYKSLEFQKLMNGSYEPQRFNGTWVSDDEILMKDSNGHIVLFNVNNFSTTVLAENTTRNIKKCFEYNLSADKEYLLLAYSYRKVYRHSYRAYYDLIDVQTGEQFTLQNSAGEPWELQLVKWSPTGHSLAVVDQNDILYIKNISNISSTARLTFTGAFELYNGIPDWVYEEEIFSSNSAMWFSTKGSKIAYASFNDSLVPIMQIPFYGMPGNLKYQYTSLVGVHYPKVGVPNPIVQLFVENLNESKSNPIPIQPPTELTKVSPDIILNTVVWSDDANLFVMWMNRIQNESFLVHYMVDDSAKIIKEVKFVQSGGWLDFTQTPLTGDQHRLAIIYPTKQEAGDNFKHVVIVETDGRMTPVTSGRFEVLELLKWDVESNHIYYLANTEQNPEEQYLYRTTLDGKKRECLSCKPDCKYGRVDMHPENNYYTLVCNGPDVPVVEIYKMNGEKVYDWEMNVALKKLIAPLALPRISFIDVPINADFKARVRLILPPSLDENAAAKYPLLVNTYAGPGSNLALNKYSMEWNMYFCTSKRVVIAQIDGRGTARRGDKNLFANYRKLGTSEIEDQIFVANYLQNRYAFIDKTKTAIWGWSYGGYAAGMALAQDNSGVFKCGLSVAPVTDWIYYDTIYTERYMGLIEDNTANYKNASLLGQAENLRNKKFMVIHGTYDDNVHYQQSMMLSYELERRVILFRQQSYPDESHGLTSVRNHVYKTISSFLSDCYMNKL